MLAGAWVLYARWVTSNPKNLRARWTSFMGQDHLAVRLDGVVDLERVPLVKPCATRLSGSGTRLLGLALLGADGAGGQHALRLG